MIQAIKIGLFTVAAAIGAISIGDSAAAQPTTVPTTAPTTRPTVYLVGDSTVRVNGNGQQGWGDPFVKLFDPAKVNVVNKAIGGRSSRSFIQEGRWDEILKTLTKGDYVIVPCTALAAVELIRSTGYRLEGAEAVVVGASAIAGRPAALLLTQAGATVTICHKYTRDLKSHTRRADVLVVAAGVPNLIAANHIREGAVVIDVGINRVTTLDGTTKTVGDVNFEDVKSKAAYISPVPGGVGPMTVTMLLNNVVRAAEMLAERT